MMPNTRAFRSGELGRLAGVSADTVRFYERRCLLPAAPRSASGYRLFSAEALARVKLIRGAISAGFSVNELALILRERDRGGAPCRRVRKLAGEKLIVIETQLAGLRRWRQELRRTLAEWDRRLRKTPDGQRAELLESLVVDRPARRSRGFKNALPGRNQTGEKRR